jgi:hypothetical protein
MMEMIESGQSKFNHEWSTRLVKRVLIESFSITVPTERRRSSIWSSSPSPSGTSPKWNITQRKEKLNLPVLQQFAQKELGGTATGEVTRPKTE